MFLFQDLVIALVLSVFFSLLFATAKVVGKSTSSSVKQVETDDEEVRMSGDGNVSSGVGYEVGVFDESPVRTKGGGIAVDSEVAEDDVELVKGAWCLESGISKECSFSRAEIGVGFDGILDRAKSGKIAVVKNVGNVEAMEAGVSDKEISKESSLGGLEFEEHIVDEIQDMVKNQNFVTGFEKNLYNVEFEGDLGNERPERVKYGELIIRSEKKEDNLDQLEEVRVLESKEYLCSVNEDDDNEEWLDDWEGIERTELEKTFGDAVVFVGSKNNAHRISSFDNELKMQLYGLHKVAIKGACRVQQPMALKVSARAKWNAWHLLGDMSREVAMEQYIALLSKSLPEWKGDDHNVSSYVRPSISIASNLMEQPGAQDRSISEGLEPYDTGCKPIVVEHINSSREKE